MLTPRFHSPRPWLFAYMWRRNRVVIRCTGRDTPRRGLLFSAGCFRAKDGVYMNAVSPFLFSGRGGKSFTFHVMRKLDEIAHHLQCPSRTDKERLADVLARYRTLPHQTKMRDCQIKRRRRQM